MKVRILPRGAFIVRGNTEQRGVLKNQKSIYAYNPFEGERIKEMANNIFSREKIFCLYSKSDKEKPLKNVKRKKSK
jgi:hypothetical protein